MEFKEKKGLPLACNFFFLNWGRLHKEYKWYSKKLKKQDPVCEYWSLE